MGRYLVRRFLWAGFTLWGLATLLFFGLLAFPGGPFDDDLALNPEVRAGLERAYGISDPMGTRYLKYLESCLNGNLGVSLHFPGQSVASVLQRGFSATMLLNVSAAVVVILLGLALGLAPHLKPMWPKIPRGIARLGLSLPGLFLAPLLLWILCFHWDLFPLRYDGSLWSSILPIFALSFRPACGLARVLDIGIRENRRQDFARTYRSLGGSENGLVLRWLLRPSSINFVQVLPATVAHLLSGSLLIEPLFSMQGLGQQFVLSLMNRDWSLAMGLTLFFCLILVIGQLVVDALMMIMDPRLVVK